MEERVMGLKQMWQKIQQSIRRVHKLEPERLYKTKYSGQETPLAGVIEAYGENIKATLGFNKDGVVEYTHAEISQMAIACAACGLPIWLGDPVGLATFKPGYQVPEGSHFCEESKAYPICFRWECTHPDRNGFWLPKPDDPLHCHVFRVISPMEMAMSSGDCVIISDMRDIGAAVAATNEYIKHRSSAS